MRLPVLTVALLIALSFALTSQAHAQQYVDTTKLKPFTAECGYMSREGYLRYRYYVTSGEWIAFDQAASIVAEQK